METLALHIYKNMTNQKIPNKAITIYEYNKTKYNINYDKTEHNKVIYK